MPLGLATSILRRFGDTWALNLAKKACSSARSILGGAKLKIKLPDVLFGCETIAGLREKAASSGPTANTTVLASVTHQLPAGTLNWVPLASPVRRCPQWCARQEGVPDASCATQLLFLVESNLCLLGRPMREPPLIRHWRSQWHPRRSLPSIRPAPPVRASSAASGSDNPLPAAAA